MFQRLPPAARVRVCAAHAHRLRARILCEPSFRRSPFDAWRFARCFIWMNAALSYVALRCRIVWHCAPAAAFLRVRVQDVAATACMTAAHRLPVTRVALLVAYPDAVAFADILAPRLLSRSDQQPTFVAPDALDDRVS